MENKKIVVGSKVKINMDQLELIGFDGLRPEDNASETDHASYIVNNPDNVYEVIGLADNSIMKPFVLGDDTLKTTSFGEEELLLV